MLHDKKDKNQILHINPLLANDVLAYGLPCNALNENSMDSKDAYRLIKDDLLNEGRERQNLATFCQTYMEEEAVHLMAETLSKNLIDKTEYPRAAEIESRCVNMIANLWNVQADDDFVGTSTLGSSEACMLAGMAMKFDWRKRAEANHVDIGARKPNIVISSAFQVCWEKFCVYWDIEMRQVPITSETAQLDLHNICDYFDDYTIGVVGIHGITYTGRFDDIKQLDEVVETYNKTAKIKVSIHVDAASGGLFTPFVDASILWDFRLHNVISINTSGHKYGLVYPGVGWILWRDKKHLPKELVFEVSYLGGNLASIGINFSRSASPIIGQYYNFIRFGKSGYKEIHERTKTIANYIAIQLQNMEYFEILNDGTNMPIVCWKMAKETGWDLYKLSDYIRMFGWQVPAYPLLNELSDTIIQRVVIKADFSMQMAIDFIADVEKSIKNINEQGEVTNHHTKHGFTH